jgi:hypothetical protein
VVTVQQFAQLIPVRTSVMPQVASRLWLLLAANIAAFLWTATLGSWFDHTSRLTSIVTLGGHHVLVMIFSCSAAVVLAALALVSNGFRDRQPGAAALVALSYLLSMVALIGFVSLVLVIVLSGLFVGLMVRLFT